jgi:MATE family multidrug resistance protein
MLLAGHAASAKRAFLGGIASGSLMQAALALTITLQGNALVQLFTNDPQVISTCSPVLPLLAVLVFFDGVNSVVSGVLRGSGRQMLGAVCNFWGYFIVGLPLSAYLAFKAGMGIHGLWLGIIAGACVQAAVLVTMLLRWDWQKEVARVQALLKDVPGGKVAPQYGH